MRVRFEIVHPDTEEVHWDDDPVGTVRENARRKCEWCMDRYPEHRIIAADTVVELDGRPIAKPSDMEEAFRFLRSFSGRHQQVHTGVALKAPGHPPKLHVQESEVVFRDLTDEEIRHYFELVNPLDKAGGYNIDQHGELIIDRIRGSWTNIMGLPVEIVEPWLEVSS